MGGGGGGESGGGPWRVLLGVLGKLTEGGVHLLQGEVGVAVWVVVLQEVVERAGGGEPGEALLSDDLRRHTAGSGVRGRHPGVRGQKHTQRGQEHTHTHTRVRGQGHTQRGQESGVGNTHTHTPGSGVRDTHTQVRSQKIEEEEEKGWGEEEEEEETG